MLDLICVVYAAEAQAGEVTKQSYIAYLERSRVDLNSRYGKLNNNLLMRVIASIKYLESKARSLPDSTNFADLLKLAKDEIALKEASLESGVLDAQKMQDVLESQKQRDVVIEAMKKSPEHMEAELQQLKGIADWNGLSLRFFKQPAMVEAALSRVEQFLIAIAEGHAGCLDEWHTKFLGLWRVSKQHEWPIIFMMHFYDDQDTKNAWLRVNSRGDGNCFYYSIFNAHPELLLLLGYTVPEVMKFIRADDDAAEMEVIRKKLADFLVRLPETEENKRLLAALGRNRKALREEETADLSDDEARAFYWECLRTNKDEGDISELALFAQAFGRHFCALTESREEKLVAIPRHEYVIVDDHTVKFKGQDLRLNSGNILGVDIEEGRVNIKRIDDKLYKAESRNAEKLLMHMFKSPDPKAEGMAPVYVFGTPGHYHRMYRWK